MLHAVFVFDLGGITHFTGENQFPVAWSADEEAMLTGPCWQPTDWDIYWTRQPCLFVMKKLEGDTLAGLLRSGMSVEPVIDTKPTVLAERG